MMGAIGTGNTREASSPVRPRHVIVQSNGSQAVRDPERGNLAFGIGHRFSAQAVNVPLVPNSP